MKSSNNIQIVFNPETTPGAVKISKRKTNILKESLLNYNEIKIDVHDNTFFDNEYFKKVWKNAHYL